MADHYIIDGFRDGLDGTLRHIEVRNGLIVSNQAGPAPERSLPKVDFAGKWLLPRFIDNHCHVISTGKMLAQVNLSSCQSKADTLDCLRDAGQRQSGGWLQAHHYDQNRWNGEHLNADELDQVISDRPVFVLHSNGHAAIANTSALRAAGLDPRASDPAGGTFGRKENGEINGVLLENAVDAVAEFIPPLSQEEATQAAVRACELISSLGYSAACDMSTNSVRPLRLLRAFADAAAKTGIILRAYLPWSDVFGPNSASADELAEYRHLIGGVKLFADGAIGSATAAIYGSFLTRPAAPSTEASAASYTSRDASGIVMYPPSELNRRVSIAHEAGFQVAVHAIGDMAADLVMDAFEKTSDPARHRIEHAMILSSAQIERLARLGCSVSMQPEFLMRFHQAYCTQLPAETVRRLKPMKSVLKAGIPLSSSTDRPIVPGDPMLGARTAARRPDGYDLSENLSAAESLSLWLEPSAKMSGLEGACASLKVGIPVQGLVFDEDPKTLKEGLNWTDLASLEAK